MTWRGILALLLVFLISAFIVKGVLYGFDGRSLMGMAIITLIILRIILRSYINPPKKKGPAKGSVAGKDQP